MNLGAVALLAVASLGGGCKKRSFIESDDARPQPPTKAEARPPGEYGLPSGVPLNANVVVANVAAAVKPPLGLETLDLSYVRADGSMDLKYGEVNVQVGQLAGWESNDDPDRPIGAPVVDANITIPDTCDWTMWKAGVFEISQRGCPAAKPAPSRACTIAMIWGHAIADGAPANALATLRLQDDGWAITIDDEPRNYHFAKTYKTAQCAAPLEHAGVPAEAGSAADALVGGKHAGRLD